MGALADGGGIVSTAGEGGVPPTVGELGAVLARVREVAQLVSFLKRYGREGDINADIHAVLRVLQDTVRPADEADRAVARLAGSRRPSILGQAERRLLDRAFVVLGEYLEELHDRAALAEEVLRDRHLGNLCTGRRN